MVGTDEQETAIARITVARYRLKIVVIIGILLYGWAVIAAHAKPVAEIIAAAREAGSEKVNGEVSPVFIELRLRELAAKEGLSWFACF